MAKTDNRASRQAARHASKQASANTSAQALANYKALQPLLSKENLTVGGKHGGNVFDASLGDRPGTFFAKMSLARIQSRLPWLARKAKHEGNTTEEAQLESLEY